MKSYRQIGEFYLKEGEEELLHAILPRYYVDKRLNDGDIDVQYALRFMQDELNELLNSFLNGGFSNKGYLFYPFVRDVSEDNVNKIKRLKDVAVFLDKNGFDFSKSIGKYRNGINSMVFADILGSLYNDLCSLKSEKPVPSKKPLCSELDLNKYDKNDRSCIKPLGELKNYANKCLKQHLIGFYLHGSLATRDYVKGWSDVDTLGIVSKNTISNPRSLMELRSKLYYMRYFFYKIDPLQHHGAIMISEHDLGNYCESYFPLQVLKYACSLFPKDHVANYSVRDFSNESVSRMFWFVDYFRHLKERESLRMGSYEEKAFLHSITLFPSLYLQARGIIVYKKFSFDIARKDFSKESWKVVDEVGSMRNGWKEFGSIPLSGTLSKPNPLIFYQLNFRIMDLARRKNKVDARHLADEMLNLSEMAWEKVKKNAK